MIARAAQFEEELLVCEVPGRRHRRARRAAAPTWPRSTRALVLGLRDYVRKNGFRHVGLALSGGIDSALVALLAADAVGAEQRDLRGHALAPFQR